MSSAQPAILDIDYEMSEEIVRGRRDGSLIRDKARMMVEFFVLPKWADLLQQPLQTPGVILEIAKELAKLGDLNPKANVVTPGSGSGFSITINMADGKPLVGMANITPATAPPKTLTLSGVGTAQAATSTTVDELPPKPAGFKMPDFTLTQDLMGPPTPDTL